MLGIFLIYFVGKQFYKLAEINNKKKWLFAILGVISYYIGLLVGAAIIEVVYLLYISESEEPLNDIGLSVMALPIGILTCWGFYTILKKSWSKPSTVNPIEALDGDFK